MAKHLRERSATEADECGTDFQHRLQTGYSLLAVVASAVLLALTQIPLAAQITTNNPRITSSSTTTGNQKPPSANLEFEVASVKPGVPGTAYSESVSLDGLDGPAPTGNIFSANAPLHAYLLFAYKISDSGQARSIYDKLPSWAKAPEFFTIEARSEGAPTRDQLRLMVQALLADRFKLVIRREMQMREEHVLVFDKPGQLGPQLRQHRADQPCIDHPGSDQLDSAPTANSDAAKFCGMATWLVDGQLHLRMNDVTMEQAAKLLSNASMSAGNLAPHTGVDGTGLPGRFDLDLQFMPETDGPGSNLEGSGPPFATALKRQLGLKLTERKTPVETIVIDHVEKPSAN